MKYILSIILLIAAVANLYGQDLMFSFIKDSSSHSNKVISGDGFGMEFGNSGIEVVYSPFTFKLKSTEYQLSHNVLHFRAGQREFHDAMFKFYQGKDTMTVIIRKKDLLQVLPEVYDRAFKIAFSPNSIVYISSQPASDKLLISPYAWNENECWDDIDSVVKIFNSWLSTYPKEKWKTTITKLNKAELEEFNSKCVASMLKRIWRHIFSKHFYQPCFVNSTVRYSNDTIYEESMSEMRSYIVLNKRDSSGHFIILQHTFFYDNNLSRKKEQTNYTPNEQNVHLIRSYWDENGVLYRVDKYIDKKNDVRYLIEYSNNIFKRKRKRVYRKGGKPLKKNIANKK
jgi:hypothetical protein